MVPKNKQLEALVRGADRASSKTRFGCYPMAPSMGLTDKQIAAHGAAQAACLAALEALRASNDSRADLYERAVESHSWVVNRRGAF